MSSSDISDISHDYDDPLVFMDHTSVLQPVLDEFLQVVEGQSIPGCYTHSGNYYKLNDLSGVVHWTLTPDSVANVWKRNADHLSNLATQGLVHQVKTVNYIQLAHFLIHCLSFAKEPGDQNQSWKTRVESLNQTKEQWLAHYPGVPSATLCTYTFPNSRAEDFETLTDELKAEDVRQNVTNIVWLRGHLAHSMQKNEFAQFVLKDKDALYRLNELICVAAPYNKMSDARVTANKLIERFKKVSMVSLGSSLVKGKDGNYYLTTGNRIEITDVLLVVNDWIDLFISEVWKHLANKSGNQVTADAFARGDSVAGNLARYPSSMLISIVEANMNQLNQSNPQDMQAYKENVARYEEEMGQNHLAISNEIRDVRTMGLAAAVLTGGTDLELSKYRMCAKLAAKRISEDAEIRRKDLDTQARIAEAEGVARKAEAEGPARKAEAEARKAEAEARKAETELQARKAEADGQARQAEAEAKKTQYQVDILHQIRSPSVKINVDDPVRVKRKYTKRQKPAAVGPSQFKRPTYSEEYTRPRRGEGSM